MSDILVIVMDDLIDYSILRLLRILESLKSGTIVPFYNGSGGEGFCPCYFPQLGMWIDLFQSS